MFVSRKSRYDWKIDINVFLFHVRLIVQIIYIEKNPDDNNGCTRQKASFCIPRRRNGFSISMGFFLVKELRMKNHGRNDDRCVRQWKKKEKERREKKRTCTFPMRYRARMDGRIYIRVITAIRHTERAYIRVYINSSTSLFLYSASPFDGTFLVGTRAKITDGKLGVRPVYVGVSSPICQEE